MAKKRPAPKSIKKPATKASSGRIVLRTGEALVEAEPAWSAAEPEVVIGELDGPVGYALANLIGDQVKGHTRVFAILNSDVSDGWEREGENDHYFNRFSESIAYPLGINIMFNLMTH